MKLQVKSILLDDLLSRGLDTTTTEINGKWYCSKPLVMGGWLKWRRRFSVAWKVFKGKSFAVHFKQDEL